MKTNPKIPKDINPDKIPLTSAQASRLSTLSRIDSKALEGKTIADLEEKFKWEIDPQLFLFQKVCGKVVKKDPSTDELLPVPYATVHVEDTDCNLFGYFPADSNWSWFFPQFCKREILSSVVTDECGNFCVYIPRFEIDWIKRWRKLRICYPVIFERPTLRDILDDLLQKEPPRIRWPIPQPDPGPLLPNGGLSLDYIKQFADERSIEKLSVLQNTMRLGETTEDMDQVLNTAAFSRPLPPPLNSEVRQLCEVKNTVELARKMAVSETLIRRFDYRHYIGPFKRCRDIYFPEWQMISDVPDITFRVTQDVDGDGDEETIYSEAYFDVRWNDTNIPDVVLEASQIALTSVDCGPMADIPCGSPEVVLAGKMPLHNEPGAVPFYVDNGYSKRVNRPHATGISTEALPPGVASATSPLSGYFPLYGCNQYDGAKYYRLRYIHTPENSLTPLAKKTYAARSWKLYRWVGHLEVLQVTGDVDGWYEILDPDDGWMPAYLLYNWPTNSYSDGLYEIEMELANSSKSVIHTTSSVKVRIDNSKPKPRITRLRWSLAGLNSWQNVGLNCPVIKRPGGQSIDLEVSYESSADHLRSMSLTGQGCGASGQLQLISGSASVDWWHRHAADNFEAKTAIYRLDASMLPGAYGFYVTAHSRGFNPVHSAGLTYDWYVNLGPIWSNTSLRVSVVDV